jgi:hypothetical protein
MNSKVIRFVFVAFWFALAALVAWLAWGVLNPAVQAAIPEAGGWHDFISIACTILIAYFGGIGLPFMFFCIGIYSWIASR